MTAIDQALTSPAPTSDDLASLCLQIADLRQRVLELERRNLSLPLPAMIPVPVPEPIDIPGLDLAPGMIATIGRMLLVIAGAYVLRALTEWDMIPPQLGVALGLVYGFIWLGIAARTARRGSFAIAINASTSVLILAPLVWEATVRLRILRPEMTAGIVTLYAVTAITAARMTHLPSLAFIPTASAILLAGILFLNCHDAAPFTAPMLVIAAAGEIVARQDARLRFRSLAAISAGAAVLLWSWLIAGSGVMPESWSPAPARLLLIAQIALAAVYLASAIVQSAVRGHSLTLSEILHTSSALVIGMGTAVWVFHAQRSLMVSLGIAALAGGIACYAMAFRLFEQRNKWNFRAWATFGLVLVLAGFALPFSFTGFWLLCGVSAIVSCWVSIRFHLPTLSVHGAIWYAIAGFASGVAGRILAVFFDDSPLRDGIEKPLVVLAMGLAAWSASAIVPNDRRDSWRNQFASAVIGAHVVWISSGLLASISAVGSIGTFVLAASSIALAWIARRWDRAELLWLVYFFMAVSACKLATRDFRGDHHFALVISLLSYGGALIILPRISSRLP